MFTEMLTASWIDGIVEEYIIFEFVLKNLLVILDCLKFKEKMFHKIKDIPRRFLPCTYFELIIYE